MKFETQVAIDNTIGRIICAALVFLDNLRRPKAPEKINKVLVTKLRGVGDIVLALPMIKALKDDGKEVIFLGSDKNRFIVEGQPFVDHVIYFKAESFWGALKLFSVIKKIRKEKIEASLDLTQSFHFSAMLNFLSGARLRVGFENRSKLKKNKNRIYTHLVAFNDSQHLVESYFDLLRPLGIETPASHKLVDLKFSREDRANVVGYLKARKTEGRRFVGIHLSSLVPAKRWAGERWAEIVDYLNEKEFTVVAVGLAGENSMVEKVKSLLKNDKQDLVNVAGVFSLPQLIALMPLLKFFLAKDGGPMHIAAAMGLPTLGLFGPETPVRYAPYNEKSVSLYRGGDFDCSPCSKPYSGFFPRCKKPLCLEAIKTVEVLDFVKDFVRNYGR